MQNKPYPVTLKFAFVMKKIVTLLIFVLSLNMLFAQEWASVGTVWNYDYEHIFGTELSYNTIESIGDTILNGQSCRILKTWKPSCDMPNYGFDDDFGHIYTYEENGVVYFYNPALDDFVILYDFNAEAGDSWTTTMPESPYQSEFDFFIITVDSTSTTELNGQQLKTLHVTYSVDTESGGHPFTIVETLGNLQSLFFGYLGIFTLCDAEYNQGLRCFESEELGQVQFVDFPCDSTWVWSTSEPEEILIDLRAFVYPNPSQDFLTLQIINNDSPRTFEIYDLHKKLLYRKEISDANFQSEIDVRSYETGVYFWILKDEKGIVRHGKFLVKD